MAQRREALVLNRRVVLASRPQGGVSPANFRLEERPVAAPGPGEVLVRVRYLSLDPYMRMRLNDVKSYAVPQKLDEVMLGGTVGEVVASRHPGFAPGEAVVGPGGWQEFYTSTGAGLRKVSRALPLEVYLGKVTPQLPRWQGWAKAAKEKLDRLTQAAA